MLPGARASSSGDRTRLDRTSCPGPSMMMPNGFARWRIPGETGSQRVQPRRVLARTGASRTQSGNDVRTTSPRLRGELRLTLDTLSHYSPVFIAPLAINSLRRRVQFFLNAAARATELLASSALPAAVQHSFDNETAQRDLRFRINYSFAFSLAGVGWRNSKHGLRRRAVARRECVQDRVGKRTLVRALRQAAAMELPT